MLDYVGKNTDGELVYFSSATIVAVTPPKNPAHETRVKTCDGTTTYVSGFRVVEANMFDPFAPKHRKP